MRAFLFAMFIAFFLSSCASQEDYTAEYHPYCKGTGKFAGTPFERTYDRVSTQEHLHLKYNVEMNADLCENRECGGIFTRCTMRCDVSKSEVTLVRELTITKNNAPDITDNTRRVVKGPGVQSLSDTHCSDVPSPGPYLQYDLSTYDRYRSIIDQDISAVRTKYPE
jgi:hypothetical protein